MKEAKWPRLLVLVRHGESHRNIAKGVAESKGELVYASEVRDADTPLTARGQQQCIQTGQYLRSQRFDQVVVSPYQRTLETARLITQQFEKQVPVVQEERVREIEWGILDGLTGEGHRTRFPEEWKRKQVLGKYWYRPPGGESRPDVALRLQSFLGTLSRDYRGKAVLVVTHSVVVLMFRRLLERMTEEEYLKLDADPQHEVFNCSVTHYLCNPATGKTGKLMLQEFNGVYYDSMLADSEECKMRAAHCLEK